MPVVAVDGVNGEFQCRHAGHNALEAPCVHVAANDIVGTIGKGQTAQRNVASGTRTVDEDGAMNRHILRCAVHNKMPSVARAEVGVAHTIEMLKFRRIFGFTIDGNIVWRCHHPNLG